MFSWRMNVMSHACIIFIHIVFVFCCTYDLAKSFFFFFLVLYV